MPGVLDQTIHWGVSNLDTQKEFLLAGLGWGLVPAHLIEKEIENQELYRLPLSTPIISDVNLYLIRRRDRPLDLSISTYGLLYRKKKYLIRITRVDTISSKDQVHQTFFYFDVLG